jgi:hypothetical protein
MAESLMPTLLFGWAPFGSLIVGVLYFVMNGTGVSISKRVLAAAYAPAAALLYVVVAMLPLGVRSAYVAPIYPLLQFVPVGLFVVSLFVFSGPRWAHAVLVPVALVCVAWQGIWSYFAVYGK